VSGRDDAGVGTQGLVPTVACRGAEFFSEP
jgi:hypothetical protein